MENSESRLKHNTKGQMGRKMVQKYKGANSLKFKSYENKTQNPVAKDHHIHIIELLYLCT